MASRGPSDIPRSFPRGQALVFQANWITSRLPHLSLPLTYSATALEKQKQGAKGHISPQYAHSPIPWKEMGRACKAASHSCCTGKGQREGRGKGGTGPDAEVNHAHFRQLLGSHATSLALGNVYGGGGGNLGQQL